MAPRISFSPGAKYPVGELGLVVHGCLATVFLPAFWAARWIWRQINNARIR